MSRIQEYFSTIPVVTKALLFVNVSIHITIFVTSFPIFNVAISPILIISYGEYYRLVSSAFVHLGLLHIGMNMSTLVAIGRSLEMQFGSLAFIFLTLWMLVLTGATFVGLVWLFAQATQDPGALKTSAVGYSGVLFAYALVEAFHSPESSRSVFGLFSVPTKAYPFILLVLIQVMMPNISWWGHLSGLLVGLLLTSRPGVTVFMPGVECLRVIEQSLCGQAHQGAWGYVPVQDKALVLPGLDCGACGGALGWALYGAAQLLLFCWHALSALLQLIGVPAAALQGTEATCSRLLSFVARSVQSLAQEAATCAEAAHACCERLVGQAGQQQEGGAPTARALWYSLSGYALVGQEEASEERGPRDQAVQLV